MNAKATWAQVTADLIACREKGHTIAVAGRCSRCGEAVPVPEEENQP